MTADCSITNGTKFHRWDGRPFRRAGLTPDWVLCTGGNCRRCHDLTLSQHLSYDMIALQYALYHDTQYMLILFSPFTSIYSHDNNKNTTLHNKKDEADWKTCKSHTLTVLVLIRQHVAASSGLLIAFDILGWESPRPPRWHSIIHPVTPSSGLKSQWILLKINCGTISP